VGAWGPGSFQNDTALDFLENVLRGGSIRLVVDTLAAAGNMPSNQELDIQVAEKVLAASELIAVGYGRDPRELPENAQAWVRDHHGQLSASMLALASRAVKRVVHELPSYRDLWFDPEKAEAWSSNVQSLAEWLAGADA
jgi:hypothetical protein